jgi:hypothetical protein
MSMHWRAIGRDLVGTADADKGLYTCDGCSLLEGKTNTFQTAAQMVEHLLRHDAPKELLDIFRELAVSESDAPCGPKT